MLKAASRGSGGSLTPHAPSHHATLMLIGPAQVRSWKTGVFNFMSLEDQLRYNKS